MARRCISSKADIPGADRPPRGPPAPPAHQRPNYPNTTFCTLFISPFHGPQMSRPLISKGSDPPPEGVPGKAAHGHSMRAPEHVSQSALPPFSPALNLQRCVACPECLQLSRREMSSFLQTVRPGRKILLFFPTRFPSPARQALSASCSHFSCIWYFVIFPAECLRRGPWVASTHGLSLKLPQRVPGSRSFPAFPAEGSITPGGITCSRRPRDRAPRRSPTQLRSLLCSGPCTARPPDHTLPGGTGSVFP